MTPQEIASFLAMTGETMSNLPKPPVCIDSFRHVFEAEFLKGLLHENGIDAAITSQRGMSGTGARLASRHALMVPGAQADEARRILEELARENEARAHEEPEHPENVPGSLEFLGACPNCGSTNITRLSRGLASRALDSLLLPLGIIRQHEETIFCKNCDWDSRRR